MAQRCLLEQGGYLRTRTFLYLRIRTYLRIYLGNVREDAHQG